ncbi:MAG: hypothetical protein HW391_19 [Chloroflexi bacterium]|nr:hypothetical protein [Chloroflexota bacterium]
MSSRDPRHGRADRRPAFGLGPIARVPTLAAVGRPAAGPTTGLSSDPGRAAVPVVSTGPVMGGGSWGSGLGRSGADLARARAFGLPNLRRNVCPHFYMTGARGAIPIHAPHLLKALVRQDATTSRCQLRGGVHMEQGYVNDVCLAPRFNQCVFYEEDLTAS